MGEVGKSQVRVDAFDKATGRTKYYEDMMPRNALYVRIKHAEIAHGFVKTVDTSAAEAIDGVVKVITCFDVPDIAFPTAGHPWSMDPSHQDIADRHLLNRHVRYYGDDVCAVIAEDEVAAIYELHLLTMKPMLYIANVDEDAVDAELPEIDGCTPVPISAKVEADIAELAEMDPDEAKEYMEALGLTDSGLARLIREAYHLLGLQSYFTSGETETRAWTIPVGAKAPQAAGVIHSDFERGFIKAETASFEDYVALGGEKGCRDAGKLRQEGKDYVVQDGDVMHFKFNV